MEISSLDDEEAHSFDLYIYQLGMTVIYQVLKKVECIP